MRRFASLLLALLVLVVSPPAFGQGWNPASRGGGGGSGLSWPLLAPGGSTSAPSYSWSGDANTGFYHLSLGAQAFATAGTDSFELGNQTIANLQAANVTVGARLYQLPVGTNSETAALYIKNNYTQGTQATGIEIEIPTTQLDTYGSAITVHHLGGGDGIYVAQLAGATAGGAGVEVASFQDQTKGIISTKQGSVGATSNQTLFNGLWAQTDIPNYGALYLSGMPAHAITIQNFTTVSDGYPQVRIVTNDLSRDLFGIFPDAHIAMAAPASTSGVTTNDGPILRMNGTYWNGSASVDRSAYFVHHMLSTSPTSDLRLYLGPVGSEQLIAIHSPNTTTDSTSGLTSGAGGVLDVQVGQLLNVARVWNATKSLELGTNGATIAYLEPGAASVHQAAAAGIVDAQSGATRELTAYLKTTNAGAAIVDTGYAPASGHTATMEILWNVQDTSTHNTAGAMTMVVVKNVAGVLTVSASGAGTSTFGDASVNTSAIGFAISGSNTVEIQGTPPGAYTGTLDWQFRPKIVEN